jgi:DNA-binding Xre family transcriptional regulator
MRAMNAVTTGDSMPLMPVRWKLKEFLQENEITPYKLSKAVAGELSQKGVYRLTSEELSGVNFDTLSVIIPVLRDLTGKPVNVQDLLEYQE